MSAARKVLLVAFLAGTLLPALAGACPLCKEATADTPGGTASLGEGFYYSILLMIAAPFATVATLGFLIFRSRRRARKSTADDPVRFLADPRGARL